MVLSLYLREFVATLDYDRQRQVRAAAPPPALGANMVLSDAEAERRKGARVGYHHDNAGKAAPAQRVGPSWTDGWNFRQRSSMWGALLRAGGHSQDGRAAARLVRTKSGQRSDCRIEWNQK